MKVLNKIKNMPIVAKVSIAYTICNILQKCLSFITLPLFTRLLTQEQYGQYSIYASWMGIITIFISMNLPYGSFSTAMVKYEDAREKYISSVQSICTLFAIVFLVMYLPFSKYLNKLFELPTELIILMIFEIVLQTSILFWNGKMRFEYKYKGVVAITLIMSVLSPLLAYVFVSNSEEKGYARILGYSLIVVLFGLFFYVYNYIKGKTFFEKKFWKYALGFNGPLIIYYLSQVVFNQSDRIMISHFSGIDKAGIYSVAYALATMLVFVLNSINNSYVPWYYEKIKEGKSSENKKVANMISLLMCVLLLAIIWLAPEVIYIMAGKDYYEAVWIVPPVTMSLLLLFYTQLFANVEFYYEKKWALIGASVGASIINIVLNYLLIPIFGYIVAGYTTLISYVIFAISNYFTMRLILKRMKIELDAFDIRSLIVICVVFMLLGFLGMLLYNYMLIRISIMAAVFILLLINTKKIYYYFKNI